MTIFMLKKYWGEIRQYFRFECVHNWCTVCTFLIYFSRRGCFMYIYFNSYHNILSQNPKRFLEVIFEPLEKLRAFRNSQKKSKIYPTIIPKLYIAHAHIHIQISHTHSNDDILPWYLWELAILLRGSTGNSLGANFVFYSS